MLRRCAAAWPALAWPALAYATCVVRTSTSTLPLTALPAAAAAAGAVSDDDRPGAGGLACIALRSESLATARPRRLDLALACECAALLRRGRPAGRRRAQSHARSAGQAAARSAPLVRCVRSLTSNTSFNVRAATAAPPCSTVKCMYVDRTDDEPMHAASDKRVYQQLAPVVAQKLHPDA